jgi:uncharacterized protein
MTEPITARPFTAAAFNQYIKEKKLMACRCKRCGRLALPPRVICAACHADQMEWVALSGKASLLGFTVITGGPGFMLKAGYGRDNPYAAGIVELAEGPHISARILGVDVRQPASIQIGMELEVEFFTQMEGEVEKTYLAFRKL